MKGQPCKITVLRNVQTSLTRVNVYSASPICWVFSIHYESQHSPKPDKAGAVKIPILDRKKRGLEPQTPWVACSREQRKPHVSRARCQQPPRDGTPGLPHHTGGCRHLWAPAPSAQHLQAHRQHAAPVSSSSPSQLSFTPKPSTGAAK